jgi:hypothetical protein
VVKGWPRRLAFCCAVPSLRSTPWHWQPAAPPDAWRGHFNAVDWASAPASNAIKVFLKRPRSASRARRRCLLPSFPPLFSTPPQGGAS